MRTFFIIGLIAVLAAVLSSKDGPLRGGAEAAKPEGRREAARDIVMVWLTVALGVGLLEVAIALYRRVIQDRLVFWSFYDPALTPLAYVALLGVPAVALLGLAFTRPRWVPIQLPTLVFAALGAEGLLLSFPRIHHWAQALLALGVAAAVADQAGRHPAVARTLARRACIALVVTTAVIATLTTGTRSIREERGIASLAPVREGAPNILLLILDTVRAASLSAYGYDRPTTPNLERIAAEGVRFGWPIAPSSWTLPTHAAIMTGRYAHETSAGYLYRLDGRFPTLAERLAEAGYGTVGIVANTNYAGRDTGLGRGFLHYEDYFASLFNHAWLGQTAGVQSLLDAGSVGEFVGAIPKLSPQVARERYAVRPTAADINRALLSWLDKRTPSPFFAFLNYYDAHEPYEPPEPYRSAFLKDAPSEMIGLYDGAIAYVDDQIAKLLGELDDRGLLENTLVVITSDHGEHMGERGLTGHGNSLYSQLVRVPLIIRLPGTVPSALEVEEPIGLADIPQTLLQIAFADTTGFPGASLGRFWDAGDDRAPAPLLSEWSGGEGPAPREIGFSGERNVKSVLEEGHHLIRWALEEGPQEELFHIWSDPEETSDLIGSAEGREIAAGLRALLDDLLRAPGS